MSSYLRITDKFKKGISNPLSLQVYSKRYKVSGSQNFCPNNKCSDLSECKCCSSVEDILPSIMATDEVLGENPTGTPIIYTPVLVTNEECGTVTITVINSTNVTTNVNPDNTISITPTVADDVFEIEYNACCEDTLTCDTAIVSGTTPPPIVTPTIDLINDDAGDNEIEIEFTYDAKVNDISSQCEPITYTVSNIFNCTVVNNNDGTFDVTPLTAGPFNFDYTGTCADGTTTDTATVSGMGTKPVIEVLAFWGNSSTRNPNCVTVGTGDQNDTAEHFDSNFEGIYTDRVYLRYADCSIPTSGTVTLVITTDDGSSIEISSPIGSSWSLASAINATGSFVGAETLVEDNIGGVAGDNQALLINKELIAAGIGLDGNDAQNWQVAVSFTDGTVSSANTDNLTNLPIVLKVKDVRAGYTSIGGADSSPPYEPNTGYADINGSTTGSVATDLATWTEFDYYYTGDTPLNNNNSNNIQVENYSPTNLPIDNSLNVVEGEGCGNYLASYNLLNGGEEYFASRMGTASTVANGENVTRRMWNGGTNDYTANVFTLEGRLINQQGPAFDSGNGNAPTVQCEVDVFDESTTYYNGGSISVVTVSTAPVEVAILGGTVQDSESVTAVPFINNNVYTKELDLNSITYGAGYILAHSIMTNVGPDTIYDLHFVEYYQLAQY